MRILCSYFLIWFLVHITVGTADADEVVYDINGFDSIHVSSGIDVDVKLGNSFKVGAQTVVGSADDLLISLRNGQLFIGLSDTGLAKLSREIWVKIESPHITKIVADTGSTVRALNISVDSIELIANRGGTIDVTGQCRILKAEANDGGSINAENFICDDIHSKAMGAGAINANAKYLQGPMVNAGGDINIIGLK